MHVWVEAVACKFVGGTHVVSSGKHGCSTCVCSNSVESHRRWSCSNAIRWLNRLLKKVEWRYQDEWP